MRSTARDAIRPVEDDREDLLRLARLPFGPCLRARMDTSDILKQAALPATRTRSRNRGGRSGSVGP